MATYYNDNDPLACEWLRELIKDGLISDGDVDDRPIERVQPSDLRGYDQCHFFCGIAGWPLALQLANWGDDPVWTGSCPCQGFSPAGKGLGLADERHLWPEFFRLIRQCKPRTIFGEQVEPAAFKFGWLDLVFRNLENENYACGAVSFPACSVGAPHIRQRLFWVAHAEGQRLGGISRIVGGQGSEEARRQEPQRQDAVPGCCFGVELAQGARCERDESERVQAAHAVPGGASDVDDAGGVGFFGTPHASEIRSCFQDAGEPSGMVHADGDGHYCHGRPVEGQEPVGIADGQFERPGAGGVELAHADSGGNFGGQPAEPVAGVGAGRGVGHQKPHFWSDAVLVQCTDGKVRPIPPPAESEFCVLADGVSDELGRGGETSRFPVITEETANRKGRLKGYGNAIVPQAASEFVRAFLEAEAAMGGATCGVDGGHKNACSR